MKQILMKKIKIITNRTISKEVRKQIIQAKSRLADHEQALTNRTDANELEHEHMRTNKNDTTRRCSK